MTGKQAGSPRPETLRLELAEDQWHVLVDALHEGADECEDADKARDYAVLGAELRRRIEAARPGTYGSQA